jgi:hypothetical protein
MDNTGFTIFNQLVDIPALPVNEEFFIQNWQASRIVEPYYLSLGQDSVVRLNRTEWSSGFNWFFRTLQDNGEYLDFTMGEGSTFDGATTYYLPAGEYLIEAHSQASGASGLYEFNIGPILEGAGAVACDVDRLIGMRIPVENLNFYRCNISLMTQENVTVDFDVDFLNMYGGLEWNPGYQFGNQQSGTSWAAFGSNTTSIELGSAAMSYTMFCNGSLILVIAPWRIRNNTAGIAEEYYGRTVDFDVTFDEDEDGILAGVEEVTIGTEFAWTNFSLWTDGDATELYAIRLSGAEGLWMNISLLCDDISAMQVYAYQDIGGCPTYVPWSDIGANLVGVVSNGSIELGGISDEILLMFDLDRNLVENGTLAIGLVPFTTNNFEYLSQPTYYAYGSTPGPVAVGIDPVLAVGVVGVIAVVVVVVVVVLKKRGAL